MAIYFEEKHAHNKSGPFVPVNKRVGIITKYSSRTGSMTCM